jgi:hypothetical protein
MKILHITPSSNGYEEVMLLANAVSKTNGLAVIEKQGQILMTGGYLINDTERIRKILNSIPKNEQYEFVMEFKNNPFTKFYYEEL